MNKNRLMKKYKDLNRFTGAVLEELSKIDINVEIIKDDVVVVKDKLEKSNG